MRDVSVPSLRINDNEDDVDDVMSWMGLVSLGVSPDSDDGGEQQSVGCIKAHGLFSTR